MSRPDPRLAPLAILALLLGGAAVMLYRVPVHRYVVSCERTTEELACVIEQTKSGGTQRWQVPLGLGDDAAAAAVVRIMPQRRGAARVLLYLESPGRLPVFAAEFEGADAGTAADAAAARLNQVLQVTVASATPDAARIEAVAPPILRWFAWAGLGVICLLILATYRHVRGGTPHPPDESLPLTGAARTGQ